MPRRGAAPDLKHEPPLTLGNVSLAWAPYVIMSVLLLLTGLARQREQHRALHVGPLRSKYLIPIPLLDRQSQRDSQLQVEGREPQPEKAEFDFPWLTAPGSAVFVAALFSMLLLRTTPTQIARVVRRTFVPQPDGTAASQRRDRRAAQADRHREQRLGRQQNPR